MASFAVTWKTQKLDIFGPSPSQKWNSFDWGSGTWGMKSAGSGGSPSIVFKFYKVWSKSNSIIVTHAASTLGKRINKQWTGGNSVLPTISVSDIEQYSGGFHYVFPGNVTNAVNESIPNYSDADQNAGSTIYSQTIGSSTSWS